MQPDAPQQPPASEDVDGLIPFCCQGGPLLNPAVYGYDVKLLRERPWAQAGANLSDYFNYGFDEQTWRAYCAMHPQGKGSVRIKAEDFLHQQQQQLFAGGGGGAGAPQQGGGGNHGGDGYGGGRSNMRRPNKTKPCFAIREGNCNRGDQCEYAHSDEELQKARQAFVATGGFLPPQGGGGGRFGGGGGAHHSGGGHGDGGVPMPMVGGAQMQRFAGPPLMPTPPPVTAQPAASAAAAGDDDVFERPPA